ncbi:hypothetical protein [Selenomonas ruminantium]|uniref:hypothetical protein n=1 Tax=Selenomonas ruminantium TaxID=971 RepID=UPI00117ABCE3|nr:hypothetical protein [Selenomonas ruminantium]
MNLRLLMQIFAHLPKIIIKNYLHFFAMAAGDWCRRANIKYMRLIVSGKQSPVVAFCLYHDMRHNSMTNVTISILL